MKVLHPDLTVDTTKLSAEERVALGYVEMPPEMSPEEARVLAAKRVKVTLAELKARAKQ